MDHITLGNKALTKMTNNDKILKFNKITKLICYVIEVAFVVAFVTLAVVSNSRKHTIQHLKYIIENNGNIQQKQN